MKRTLIIKRKKDNGGKRERNVKLKNYLQRTRKCGVQFSVVSWIYARSVDVSVRVLGAKVIRSSLFNGGILLFQLMFLLLPDLLLTFLL